MWKIGVGLIGSAHRTAQPRRVVCKCKPEDSRPAPEDEKADRSISCQFTVGALMRSLVMARRPVVGFTGAWLGMLSQTR